MTKKNEEDVLFDLQKFQLERSIEKFPELTIHGLDICEIGKLQWQSKTFVYLIFTEKQFLYKF